MADFTRPLLSELVERIRADLLTRLGVDEALRRGDLPVQAAVQAGAVHGLYGFIDFIARQILPDTAEAEYLDRHAAWWGITRKAPAKSIGSVSFAATPGANVPLGAVLQRVGGLDYLTTSSAIAAGNSVTVTVEATAAGVAGNLDAGAQLSLVAPITGVQSIATVVEIAAGADLENDDDLRARVRARISQPPHGGASFDYVTWAKEVPGVTRAWSYPQWLGLGTMGVAFVMDGRANIIPTATDVAAVAAHIDPRRPATAEVTVFAPTPAPLHMIVRLRPDTPEARAAVIAEVQDFLVREAQPGSTVYLSRLREAISQATGENRHDLISPAADVVPGPGRLVTFGSIGWVG